MTSLAKKVLFLGGNGHCAARLAPARDALTELIREGMVAPFELIEVPYPGFEDRPRAPDFDAFLGAVSAAIASASAGADAPGTRIYATGIGGLIALCLRARGEHTAVPLLLQAPVLWGLERRLMPRLMRLGLAQLALRRAFASPLFQARFVRKHFETTPPPAVRAGFFDGYARCAALPDFFAWMTPRLLRTLETELARRPDALARTSVWWGERDTVVSLDELRVTERALGVRWPVRTFAAWGHYPMIDDPAGWIRMLADAVEAAPQVRRPDDPEAR